MSIRATRPVGGERAIIRAAPVGGSATRRDSATGGSSPASPTIPRWGLWKRDRRRRVTERDADDLAAVAFPMPVIGSAGAWRRPRPPRLQPRGAAAALHIVSARRCSMPNGWNTPYGVAHAAGSAAADLWQRPVAGGRPTRDGSAGPWRVSPVASVRDLLLQMLLIIRCKIRRVGSRSPRGLRERATTGAARRVVTRWVVAQPGDASAGRPPTRAALPWRQVGRRGAVEGPARPGRVCHPKPPSATLRRSFRPISDARPCREVVAVSATSASTAARSRRGAARPR